MKFITPVNIPQVEKKINIKDPLFFFGSCFSDEIGAVFLENKFEVLSNPFGTIYNPVSMANLLRYSIMEEPIPEDSFLQQQGVFLNYLAHSKISGLSMNEAKQAMTDALEQTKTFVRKCRHAFITMGTAIIYEKNDMLVANCHKVPQKQFIRRFITVREAEEGLQQISDYLRHVNPEISITLTLSPVRHVKDDLRENSVSKAILRVAIANFIEKNEAVNYFPSYEIVLDELRGYRFFKEDLVHPNHMAVKYIFERLSETFLDNKTKQWIPDWQKLRQGINHRPFNPETAEHRQFKKKLIQKLERIDFVDLSNEIAGLKKDL